MRRWTPEEIAWHDRIVAQRAARRAEVNQTVADNWAERRNREYRVADQATGQSDAALARTRGVGR